MERCFIVSKESKYYEDTVKFSTIEKNQKEFIKKFFNEKEIEGSTYMVRGSGFMNKPFKDYEKSRITFSIEPTEGNLFKFDKMLCKPNRNNLCSFRKNSSLAKEFAQRCVDEQVPINLWSPKISDYFVSLGNGIYGCSSLEFSYNDIMYLKVDGERLTAEDTPVGFTEIKASEFYKALEDCEEESK